MAYGDYIYIGSNVSPTFSFDDTSLESVVCNNSIDLIGNELSTDVLEVSVFYDDSDEKLRGVAYATPIFYYSSNKLVGKYYVKEIKRTGAERYFIRATSLIGLCEEEQFYGGMYDGETLGAVVNDILFTDGVSPTMDVYYAENTAGTATNGRYIYDAPSGFVWGKCRLRIEFTVAEAYWSGASVVRHERKVAGYTGNNYYDVYLVQIRDDANSPAYYECHVCYGASQTVATAAMVISSADGYRIGVGSSFSIDVNPTTGLITADVRYVKYDEVAVTGVEHYETYIAYNGGNGDLSYAFGPGSNGYYVKLRWKRYEVYNELGNMIINACLVYKASTNKYYVVNACDGYGLTTNQTVFRGYGEKIGVLSDVTKYGMLLEIGDIEYVNDIDQTPIYGWMPICTRRDALHQLLFTNNASMIKGANGKITILMLSSGLSGGISEDALYNEGSEEVVSQAKRLSVTENSYSSDNLESKVIFDNSTSVVGEGEYIATFNDAPIYGTLTRSGITIKSYNCNAAVVTGRGTISGTPYIKSERVIQYENGAVMDGQEINVSGVGLITNTNADFVMNKLRAYYCAKLIKVSNGIIYDGQKCGAVYGFKSPFEEDLDAFLVRYVLQKSEISKASCEFVSGYVPPKGNGYTDFVILTYGETWTVPEELKTGTHTVRLNIIGSGYEGNYGGSGGWGQDPYYEEDEYNVEYWRGGAGGAGGTGGTGGAGGKIMVVADDVETVSYIEVRGGAGYPYYGATEVRLYSGSSYSSHSSSSGVSSADGFTNMFTGVTYALPGPVGLPGADGGNGGTLVFGSDRAPGSYEGANGQPCGDYSGGVSPANERTGTSLVKLVVYGGGGGASRGENGYDATFSASQLDSDGGNGAYGGVAQDYDGTYGCGGIGGNGGGGAGGGGSYCEWTKKTGSYYIKEGQGGIGGSGGPGGPGKDGCVIIYY